MNNTSTQFLIKFLFSYSSRMPPRSMLAATDRHVPDHPPAQLLAVVVILIVGLEAVGTRRAIVIAIVKVTTRAK